MKKNLIALVAAFGASAILLTACTAPASNAVTQPIASNTANAPAETKVSSVLATQPENSEQPLPTSGETLSINTPQPTDVSGRIGEDEAKSIALSHANLAESDVTGLRVKLDYDDGVQEYEVTFYSGNREYDYDIDAATGTIRSVDSEIEDDYQPTSTASNTSSSTRISEEEAKSIALKKAGLAESDVTGLRIKLDYDDGVEEYEVKFYSGNREYDCDINAATGEIRSFDSEIDDDYQPASTASTSSSSSTRISEDEAKSIALKKAGLAESDVTGLRVKLDRDDGVEEYEVSFHSGNREYDCDINAATGEIRSFDSEIDD